MAIAVTPGGLIITQGGLPSCTCCGCPEETVICVTYNDGLGDEQVNLIGSVSTGLFTGWTAYHELTVLWDEGDQTWQFIVDGTVNLGSSGSDRCSPVGESVHYEDIMVIVDVTVNSFGYCVVCSPDQTELCIELMTYSGSTVVSRLTLYGGLNEGSFSGSGISVSWNGSQWEVTNEAGPTDGGISYVMTDRCNPVGTIASQDGGGGPEPWVVTVLGFGPDCCECTPSFSSVTIHLDAGAFQADLVFTGSSCDGVFTNSELGAMSLYWNGSEWMMDIVDQTELSAVTAYELDSGYMPTYAPITTRCVDFMGAIFFYNGDNGPTGFTVTAES